MDTIKFTRKGKQPVEVTREDLFTNVLQVLRSDYPNTECVVCETTDESEKATPVAVLMLLKNPAIVNQYNEIITRQ